MPEVNPHTADRDLRRSLKGAAYRSLQPLVLNVLSVPAMAYIIRRLGAAGYGEWAIATSLIATTTVLTSLGLRGPFVRKVAQDPQCAAEALAAQLRVRTVLALAAGAVTVLAATGLGYSGTVIACTAIAAFGMFLTSSATTLSDLLEAFQEFPAIAWAGLIAGLFLTGLSVLAAWALPGPVPMTAVYLVGPVVTLMLLARFLRRLGIRPRLAANAPSAATLLWHGRHFAIQQLVFTASANLALLVLPKLIGTTAFGLFAAGTLLVTRLAIVPDAIATAFYPLIAKSIGSFHILRRRFLCGILVSLLLCAAIAVAVFLASDVIARILFPRTPAECQQVIAITMWALPLIGIEMMMGFALNALSRESAQARLAIIGAVVSLSLGAVMIARWQAAGACWFMLVRPAVQIALLLPETVRALWWGDSLSNPFPSAKDQATKLDAASPCARAEACGS